MYNRGIRTGPGSTYRPGSHRPPPAPTGGGDFPRTPISTIGDNAVYNTGEIGRYGQSMRPFMQGPSPAGQGGYTRPGGQPSGGGQRGDFYRPGYRGGDSYRPSYPPGWRPPGRPGGSGHDAAPPPPPPPPPPLPTGQPGQRPHNYQPTIPPDVHTHASYGGWSGSGGGKPIGGHMLTDDLPGPHPDMPGFTNGTAGWGARLPIPGQVNRPGNHRPNGVYDYPNPPIQFDTQFAPHTGGAITKPVDNHTMFPPRIPHQAVGQMATDAWQSPDARFWGDATGGGGWTGPAVIPPGYPGAGTPVKINGTYGPDGQTTGYWPSPNQPVPPPPPPAGASPTGGR